MKMEISGFMPDSLILGYLFIVGAALGSFLNVVILRLPSEEGSLLFPPSHCPACQGRIRWYDNIPIISFILLRRKCRLCGAPISWQYPLVETTMALLTVGLYVKFHLSLAFAIFLLFAGALLVIIVIDSQHMIIPDVISLPGIGIGFLCSFANPLVTWQESGLGLLFGGGVLYAVASAYFLLAKRDGMGGGDIKLLAMIGAFLGWQSLFFVIFVSSLAGAVVGIGAMIKQGKGGQSMIPFGPFLAGTALVYLFNVERITAFIRWYFFPHA